MYFTSDMGNQWGDDWDDSPYEHNAGPPYEDGRTIKKIKFKGHFIEPCSFCLNSPYSVQDINNRRCPWLIIDQNGPHYIFAGISYTNFVRQIEELGGKIYVPKKKGVK